MHLNEIGVLLYGFAVAFVIVNIIPRVKLTNRKPLNCLMCMNGWCSLGLSIASSYHWDYCLLLMAAGLTIGAIFGAIQMRWL